MAECLVDILKGSTNYNGAMSQQPTYFSHPLLSKLILLTILLFGFWIRAPFISADLPYFYDEDEGHHFNRVVDMVKNGEFDPKYFRKPSLHFYLRMPVVAASFLWNVKQGGIQSIKEIRTHDPHGLAQYSFTASHPTIVKWNRGFSVFLSLMMVLFTYLIARELLQSNTLALGSSLFVAVSPALVSDSAKIGVDTLMALFCLITIFSALKLHKNFSLRGLWLLGLLAGLAVSSKYNALPVVLLPVFVVLSGRARSYSNILIALLSPILGFFIGSPFILSNIPLFLDQLGYEVWHYGVSGHIGHSADPGLGQLCFYLNWLGASAVGWGILVCGLIGTFLMVFRGKTREYLFVVYPLMFFILMISQKTNFTRNMLIMAPVLAVTALLPLGYLASRFLITARVIGLALIIALGAQPLIQSLSLRSDILSQEKESRELAIEWLSQSVKPFSDTALSADLQFPLKLYKGSGVSSVEQSQVNPIELMMQGFDRLVVDASYSRRDSELLTIEKVFAGTRENQRIVRDPEITIYKVGIPPKEKILDLLNRDLSYSVFPKTVFGGGTSRSLDCYKIGDVTQGSENYCWIQSRFAKIVLESDWAKINQKQSDIKINLRMMSPWPNQSLILSLPGWSSTNLADRLVPGEWKEVSVLVPADTLKQSGYLFAEVGQVHVPAQNGLGVDTRRLGVAIELVVIGKSNPG